MFGSKKTRRRKQNTKNQFQKLEDRKLLAAIAFDGGQLYLAGDAGNNVATLTTVDNGSTFRATVDNVTRDIAVSSVDQINFLGFAGNDTFTNSTSATVTAYGHNGNDTLRGGPGADVLIGGAGNDRIFGNDGNDRLVGANGNDTINGGNGNDRIFGSAGTNILNGDNGDDVMYGSNDGDDIMKGGNGTDWIFGLGGNDKLYSGSGGTAEAGELLMGHGGNDEFFGGAGLNIFWGGTGDDVGVGGSGINRMHGQEGNDTLTGGSSADFIRGHAGDDTIRGMGGNDYIDAGTGSGDVVEFTKSYAGSNLTTSARGQQATVRSDGTDNVKGAEFFSFSDRQMTTDQATLAAPEAASLEELNSFRGSSRPVLSAPTDLTTFAENWSRRMSQIGLQHSSPASRQALLVGGRTTIGENVIFISDIGQTAAEVASTFQEMWANSPTHRTNMLNGNFTEVGIGIVKVDGIWWGTHVFAG